MNETCRFFTNVYIAPGISEKNSKLLADALCQAGVPISRIKATPKDLDTDKIYYPGGFEAVTDSVNIKSGITVPQKTIHELNTAAREPGARSSWLIR